MITGIESAKLKLIRAAEHLNAVKDGVGRYSARNPDPIVTGSDGKTKLFFTEPPPAEISVLAGETVYQIRSALDHLAFDLVKLNPSSRTLPIDWEKHCWFPLRLDTPKRTPTYNCFDRCLPGITKTAFTFIENLQPYHRRDAAAYLFLLTQLSNIDKHRHLNLTNAQSRFHK